MHRRTVIVGMLTASVAAFASGSVLSQDSKTELKVGLLLPITGPAAEFAGQERRAIETVVERTNALGGVNGRQIILVVKDSKADPTEAARLANQLILDDGVSALVTGMGRDALAIADLAARSQVPLFGMDSTLATTDPKASYFKWVFRTCTTPADDMQIMLKRIADDGHKKLAIFFAEDPNGQQTKDIAVDILKQQENVSLVHTVSASLKATDLTAPALTVHRSGADAVLVISSGAASVGTFLRKLRELGSTIPAYGSAALAQPALVAAAGDAAEGMILSSVFNPEDSGPHQALADLLKDNGGAKGFGSLLGAAAAATIIEGFKAGATDGASLRDAVENLPAFTPYTVSSVQYSAEDHDGWGPKNLLFVQIKDGHFKTLPQ